MIQLDKTLEFDWQARLCVFADWLEGFTRSELWEWVADVLLSPSSLGYYDITTTSWILHMIHGFIRLVTFVVFHM